jgi:hypothetical protein
VGGCKQCRVLPTVTRGLGQPWYSGGLPNLARQSCSEPDCHLPDQTTGGRRKHGRTDIPQEVGRTQTDGVSMGEGTCETP